jgi:hypothetical protein
LINTKNGKTVLILGNGPSASKIDHQAIQNNFDNLIVVNNYLDFSFADEVIPDFFCISDPNSFNDESSQLYKYLKQNDITVIASHFYRKSNFLFGMKTIFFDDRELHIPFWNNISPLWPRSYCSYTFYKALSIAIHLGYERIFILGLDNTEFKSYIGTSDNELHLDLDSFYGTKIEKKIDHTPKLRSLHGFPDGLSGRLQSYALAFGDLKKFKSSRIINLDQGSLILDFEKSDYGLKKN